METTTDPDPQKCNHCSKECVEDEEGKIELCPLCKVVPYCSEKCATADFESHRASCLVKVKLLGLQHLCAVCDEDARPSSYICKICAGIKYCSAKCKQANAAEHKLLCDTYANVSPRPTKDHRLTLLFSVDKEKPCFVWLHCPDLSVQWQAVQALVDPERKQAEASIPIDYGPVEFDQDYRGSGLSCVASCRYRPELEKNLSLGMATGHASKNINGNFAVWSTIHIEDSEELETCDTNPSDLPKVIQHFKPSVENKAQEEQLLTSVRDLDPGTLESKLKDWFDDFMARMESESH